MDKDLKLDRRTVLKGAAGLAVGLATRGTAFSFSPRNAMPLTIEASLRLAGENLLNILDPDNGYLPYWEGTVHKGVPARLSYGWPAHNLGRWWDAMMRLEEAIGFHVPKKVEEAMEANVRRFFDNPDVICLEPRPKGVTTGGIWDLHSIREGMLALNALAHWRKREWAVETGLRMIRSLDQKLRPDGTWEIDQFDACKERGKAVVHNLNPCDTHGRMIEALIWFFETTGEAEALRFADRLARWHFEHTAAANGTINPDSHADHTHSYFGTLRGLLLYGRLTGQSEYIDRVAAAYPVTVRKFVKESGYTSHNMAAESFGETTSPGDAAQLALWLAHEGHPQFLDDIDRIVRSRILPSQIVEEVPLTPEANDGKDLHRDIAKRIRGGYGGCTSHPHGGKLAVTDVTSADVHTLVDVYLHAAKLRNGVLEVPVHMDVDGKDARVETRRGAQAEVSVTLKKAAPVAIRIPQWAPPSSVFLTVDGKPIAPVVAGHYARTGKLPAGKTVVLRYDLPTRQTEETDLGQTYKLSWRGDEVTGIQPNTDWLPMYPNG